MELKGILKQFEGNAATMVFGIAMHYAQTGQVDTKHLDTDAIALALTSVLAQLHKENPCVVAAYGWQPAELPDTAIAHPSVPPPAAQ